MFKIAKRDIADVEPMTVLPTKSGETYTLGEALLLGADGLVKCTATKRPQFICVGVATDTGLPVSPVPRSTVYEVPYAEKPTAGTKVTLNTDALQVTATTTSGVFTVLSVDETTETVTGKFD